MTCNQKKRLRSKKLIFIFWLHLNSCKDQISKSGQNRRMNFSNLSPFFWFQVIGVHTHNIWLSEVSTWSNIVYLYLNSKVLHTKKDHVHLISSNCISFPDCVTFCPDVNIFTNNCLCFRELGWVKNWKIKSINVSPNITKSRKVLIYLSTKLTSSETNSTSPQIAGKTLKINSCVETRKRAGFSLNESSVFILFSVFSQTKYIH